MNQKGFTLIELIFSIVILALIMLIAVPSVTGISNAIRKSQRKNLISKIEIQASKYAYDTGKILFFVDELVLEGYIEADDNNNIVDPVSRNNLNCYAIEISKNKDSYDAKFIDSKEYIDASGECDTKKLTTDNEEIVITVFDNNNNNITNKIENGEWLTGNIKLVASKTKEGIDCTTNLCNWTSNNGLSSNGSKEISINNVNNIMESNYTFSLTTYEGDVIKYKKNINVKIDNESPTIYENEIKVTDKFIYTESKKVTIEASDGKGSGIKGYYLSKDKSLCSTVLESEYKTNNTFTINSNGKYLICVLDNVGLYTQNTLEIDYITGSN